MTLPEGKMLSLYVDSAMVQQSVHGQLGCESCHAGYSFPHQKIDMKNAFEYEKASMSVCQKCHPGQTAGVQASVHSGLQEMGITCHDCHGSHNIEPAAAASLRAMTLTLCTDCHQNEELMKPYGLSSNVVTTYLRDFHGRTSLLQAKHSEDAWIDEAVCTDCHGVHAILSVDSANSQVVKANLVGTCKKCRESATPNFPSSWMSHYEPSAAKTPPVFLARTFYWIMIPFTIVGLIIHIGIDIQHHRRLSKTERE